MGVSDNLRLVTASAVVGGALALAAGYIYYRQRVMRRRKIAGHISDIIIYPIKSGPALHLQSAECTEHGLRYKSICDRQFVLVNVKDNTYIPVRKNLKLLDLRLTYDEKRDCLILDGPGMDSLTIPLNISECDPEQVKSFRWYDDRETFYLDVGEEFAQWFTSYLGQPCRLGYSHPDINRQINPKYIYNHTTVHPQTKLLFPNSHPYLVANQSSLDDLNTRLAEPITMQGFRPNIIVGGADDYKPKPYEEDMWREMEIGACAVLYNNRPCPRCPMIYVDYQKHEMRANKEPMTTLLKYRRGTEKQDRSKSVFGVNSSLIRGGEIRVSDSITVSTQ